MEIRTYLEERRHLVEMALEDLLPLAQGRFARCVEAMRYSIEAGGKRVRPILCLAGAEAVAGPSQALTARVLPVACALECIHTYSLIHDDLPAMDDDELRRGKPTNHMVFGEAGAILAGDGLLTLAFEIMARPTPGLDAETRLRVIETVAAAAGPLGMVGGQCMDMEYEGREVDFETLRAIHAAKTGRLITASVLGGALMAGADQDQARAMEDYGRAVGLAFQIVDDLLNATSTPEQLGKAAGSDAARGKATYPALFGIEATRRRAAEAVDQALEALEGFGSQADPLRELASYIITRTR